MAKKTRRARKSSAKTTNTADAQNSDKKTHLSSTEQFALEYAYVIKDLRHVLILAVIMFTLLIIANLILQ